MNNIFVKGLMLILAFIIIALSLFLANYYSLLAMDYKIFDLFKISIGGALGVFFSILLLIRVFQKK